MSIDMVFTGTNPIGAASGWVEAECFRIRRPDVPVLYPSGKIDDRGRSIPGSAFAGKPYPPQKL
jgi:hypothetical protein